MLCFIVINNIFVVVVLHVFGSVSTTPTNKTLFQIDGQQTYSVQCTLEHLHRSHFGAILPDAETSLGRETLSSHTQGPKAQRCYAALHSHQTVLRLRQALDCNSRTKQLLSVQDKVMTMIAVDL